MNGKKARKLRNLYRNIARKLGKKFLGMNFRQWKRTFLQNGRNRSREESSRLIDKLEKTYS